MANDDLERFARLVMVRFVARKSGAEDELAGLIEALLVAGRPPGSARDPAVGRALDEIMIEATTLPTPPLSSVNWIYKRIARHWGNWIHADRARAADLQSRIWPASSVTAHGLQIAFGMRPFDALSGDFCDHYIGAEDALAILGDAMGKGSFAGLYAAVIVGTLRVLAGGERDPNTILEGLNRHLLAGMPGGEYATAVLVRWLPSASQLLLVNAGHAPNPLLVRDGTVFELTDTSPCLGIVPNAAFRAQQLAIQPGDLVIVASDGITDQPVANSTFDLAAAVRSLPVPHPSAEQVLAALWAAFDDAAVGPAVDDRSFLVLRFV